MAIFGKKKEKGGAGQDGSPTLDGQQQQQQQQQIPPPGTIGRGQAGQVHPGQQQQQQPNSLGHASKGSISGGTQGMAYGPNGGSINGPYAQQPGQSILRNGPAPQNGSGIPPPGAAGGFKFGTGSQRQQPDMMGQSGIPTPSSQMRSNAPMQGGSAMDQSATTNSPPYQNTASMGPGAQSNAGPGSGISGLPSSSASGPPLQGGPSGGDRPRTQQVVYPWSQRGLTMNAPRFLDEARQAAAVGAVSPCPFPRYGHAANSVASSNGEIYLFGGLVRESVKNDLYVVYVDRVVQPPSAQSSNPGSPVSSLGGGVNATLVQTTGEIPPPRVGHATVLVANVLILWGGDTKVRADDKQDEGLYLLNLSTREWTRVRPNGDSPSAGPVGRYGHTVSIIGSRFYVFGGQVDGTFMNDIWSFDLNSLKTMPTWELLKPSSDLPPKRTGHASVTYKDKIYIFGGTDGQYHYNDTWCYDVASNSWNELSCIGYIPVPREGHAACLVDDVMYIFGGRGVDGKDLGDLASFRISNQRWYMFANMGPSPSGRSGHALTAFQNKVVVLGGESFTGGKPDDPSIVYVLDTGKIKYPPESASKINTPAGGPTGTSTLRNNKPGSNDAGSRSMSPADGAVSPTQRIGANNPSLSALPTSPTAAAGQPQQQSAANAAPMNTHSEMLAGQKGNVRGLDGVQSMAGVGAAPPISTSPTQRGPGMSGIQSPTGNQQPNLNSVASPPPQTRGLGGAPLPYNGPRSQRSLENIRNGASATDSMSPTLRNAMPNGVPTGDRNQTISPTPQDGFHYGTMPNGSSRNGSGGAGAGELEALRKRDAWMKAALALAVKKGFVAPAELEKVDGAPRGESGSPDLNLSDVDTGAPGSEKERIVRALVSLKAQLAQAKATIAQQAQSESDRIGESDRARLAALSEAAFFRAKLDALETGNTSEAERIQRERNQDVERQLSESLREVAELERQQTRMREELKLEQQLRSSSEDRLSEATKRAMAAEAAQLKVYDELSVLQKKGYTNEASLRDYHTQVVSLNAVVGRHQADRDEARNQLEEHRSANERHGIALRELSAGLAAATARATEHERLHLQHRDLAQQHESTISRLRTELATKNAEADGHASRAAELDTLVARHREEAETHRQAVSGGLASVLAFQKQQAARSADGGVPSHVTDRLRALQEESDGLRRVHADSKQAADQAHTALDEMRDRNVSLEKQQSGLRTELSAMRSQLTIALQEVARLKDMSSTRDQEVRDHRRQAEAAQVKHALLRQFMADRGVNVPGDDELASKGDVAGKRMRELEAESEQQSRQIAETEHRLRDASARVEELTRELEHAKSRTDRSAAGGAQVEEAQRRAALAERELQEAHNTYRERTAQLESDYQTAVQFVKGSEKMLRRMKDELTKYKGENGSLQNELMNARAGMYSPDNEAAKDVEALRVRLAELTQQHDETTAENRDLERKMASLIAEHKDFRDKNREVLESNVNGSATQAAKVQELETQLASLDASLTDVRRELQETLMLNTHLSSELQAATKSGSATGQTSKNGADSASIARDLDRAQAHNEQLRQERDAISQRLQDTEDKLQLLLANDSEAGGAEGATRDSHAFSISSELDKWERDRAGMPETLQHGLNSRMAPQA